MITPNSAFTVYTVDNLKAAKVFYSNYFGFDVAFENEWYLHLVSETGVQVGFLLPNQPSQPPVFQQSYKGKGVIFSFEVDDAESAYAEAKASSLKIVLELRSEDWGQYHFCVEDPNGIHIDIVQATEPTEEYQQGYATE
jgi:catechol 2,3-dioxygenase-like lactoylglutathione lyase family enzyme